ncbi:MAG: hypothetical protein GKR89_01605 [Candidatus Latescibacteria bacterium]|nr:hypothetical protein [Candidatus Latescibacterota bacterium]
MNEPLGSKTVIRFCLAVLLVTLTAWALPQRGDQGGWSLLPPLLAIAVAVATRRPSLGLATALLGGALLHQLDAVPWYILPWTALQHALTDFIWVPLRDSFQLYILAFTLALVGMVRIVACSGGTRGIARFLARRAEGARSTQLAAFCMGLAIFFDDYANTLVVGTTMRPLADRFGVAREKLAYIVDSTAAPVAGLAVISTWIGYEVALFEDAMGTAGAGVSGYELYFKALPSRYYCILALTLVGLSVFSRRDFGPMLAVQRRSAVPTAARELDNPSPGVAPARAGDLEEAPLGIELSPLLALAPVALVVLGVLVGLQIDVWDNPDVAPVRRQYGLTGPLYWNAVFSNAYSARVMFLAAVAGSLLAFILGLTRRDKKGRPLPPRRLILAWGRGIRGFGGALVLIVLAWSIKEACNAAGTADYLAAAWSDGVNPGLLPLGVFLLGGVVAFLIGTSWATMALLLPTTLPLAYQLGGLELAAPVAAAVLDGAIFGDHCSPISDTTVLSSAATGCPHMDHVRTQLPYALTAMTAAALLGYLGGTLFYPGYVGLLLGVAALIAVLWIWGRKTT